MDPGPNPSQILLTPRGNLESLNHLPGGKQISSRKPLKNIDTRKGFYSNAMEEAFLVS